MAKKFLEAPQIPDFITRQGPYITADINSGINSLSVWEVENAKLAEGLQAAGDFMATFFWCFRIQISSQTIFCC